jgi:FkbM family methyltransferase
VNPNLVYDVGLHLGDDTAYYLHLGFRVVAVEADPALASAARLRFTRAIDEKRLVILNAGIAEKEGRAPFFVSESHPEWSSFDRGLAVRGGSACREVEVECRTLGSVFDEHGIPFFLKIDIEGNDHLCLEALRGREMPAYLSVEKSRRTLALLPELRAMGYTGFKCISQIHYLPFELPLSSAQARYERLEALLESRSLMMRAVRRLGGRAFIRSRLSRFRRDGGWVFPFGASGPFGERSAGRWQTLESLAAALAHYQKLMDAGGRSVFWVDSDRGSFWADLHLKRGGDEG